MSDRRAVLLAVIGFVAVGTAPTTGLESGGQYALATMVFAGILWVSGGLPLPITALLIPVLLTVFGVVPTVGDAVGGFADPIIFLLLAGFVLAEALQKHGTDRRIAYHVLATVGTSPTKVVFAVMLATAILSMVISNSATTAMMIPVALGIADRIVEDNQQSPERDEFAGGTSMPEQSNLRLSMLLGVAYAASIGGVGTLIGSPPNAIVVSQLAQRVAYTITFVDWLAIGVPFVVVGLPLTWYVLTSIVYPPEIEDVSIARDDAKRYLREVGPPSSAERRVLLITGATASLWILGGLGFLFEPVLPRQVYTAFFGGSGSHLFGTGTHQGLLNVVIVGMAAIPALAVAGTIEWEDVHRIDWGTIILLGGGISLANALSATGATRWLAEVGVSGFTGFPLLVIALVVAGSIIAVSEIASNTAMAAISIPILISIGPEYADSFGGSPILASVFLAVTGGIAASFGFALPVGTPPNAIAFGTGHMTKDQMLRPGVLLDVIMALVTGFLAYSLFLFVWPIIG